MLMNSHDIEIEAVKVIDGLAQWLGRSGLWPVDFPWPVTDLWLTGDHCG